MEKLYRESVAFAFSQLQGDRRYAAKHGYDAFTTTLLVSPYQKHDDLKTVCEELSALSGVEFVYRDFREGFREGQAKARELGLYMQKYCGCIFSEEDRYKKQILRDASKYNRMEV